MLYVQLGKFPERVTESVQKSSQGKNQCLQPEVRSKLLNIGFVPRPSHVFQHHNKNMGRLGYT